jgi:hypothetical protein
MQYNHVSCLVGLAMLCMLQAIALLMLTSSNSFPRLNMNTQSRTTSYKFGDDKIMSPTSTLLQSIPKISVALLMSFPNSGTTYTMDNLRHVSQQRIASNYCDTCGGGAGLIRSTTRSDYMTDGPSLFRHQNFMEEQNIMRQNYTPVRSGPNLILCDSGFTIPSRYILTKTHCDGYSNVLQPLHEDLSLGEFAWGCRRVEECASEQDGAGQAGPLVADDVVHYLLPVDKVIHLVRNPLDNLVARFYFAMATILDQDKTQLTGDHDLKFTLRERTPEGFKSYCEESNHNDVQFVLLKDSEPTKPDKGSAASKIKNIIHDAIAAYEKNSADAANDRATLAETPNEAASQRLSLPPCFGDLFRYVQWHNRAHEFFSKHDLTVGKTLLTVHFNAAYDNEEDRERTTQQLLDFLKYPWSGEGTSPYTPAKDYSHYFTDGERQNMKEFVQLFASDATLKDIGHYFR